MKIIFIFLSGFCFLFGNFGGKISIKLPKQEDSSMIKIPALDLKVGESGILQREVNGNSFIIANLVVEKIEDGVALLKFKSFDDLEQDYMPKPLGEPREGDLALFRIFYNRGIVIAPNQNLYQKILESNPNINFTHPDVFASFLANQKANMPSKENFAKFCAKFNIGLVYLLSKSTLFTLDCNSFKILESNPMESVDSTMQSPFFNRLSDEVMSKLFSMKKMEDYGIYYEKLLSDG